MKQLASLSPECARELRSMGISTLESLARERQRVLVRLIGGQGYSGVDGPPAFWAEIVDFLSSCGVDAYSPEDG